MTTEENKKIMLISEIYEALKVYYDRYRYSVGFVELVQASKENFIYPVKVISDYFMENFMVGLCTSFLLCPWVFLVWLITSWIIFVICVLILFLSLVVIVKIIIRRMRSNVILTANKQTAYTLLRHNLWRMLKTYQEDMKIRLPEHAYSLTSSNPYVLRGNVWMCCYLLRKRQPVAFDSEHIEFITDTLDDEINSMIQNMAFEGVVYPCNYHFVVDEVIDSKNTIRVYVLLIEDAHDVAYVNSRNAVNHEIVDVLEVMEDDDFGKR